ncbi:MAG: Protein nrde2 [Chaenotheca gracillima]|nr:MAG: Protein nrde2 [Chaenotheca gracillima]
MDPVREDWTREQGRAFLMTILTDKFKTSDVYVATVMERSSHINGFWLLHASYDGFLRVLGNAFYAGVIHGAIHPVAQPTVDPSVVDDEGSAGNIRRDGKFARWPHLQKQLLPFAFIGLNLELTFYPSEEKKADEKVGTEQKKAKLALLATLGARMLHYHKTFTGVHVLW